MFAKAQTGTISGVVKDAITKETLIGVNVLIDQTSGLGTVTNTDGAFKLSTPVGTYKISFSLIGYKTIVRTDIEVKTDGHVYLEIFMDESVIEMDEVTIKGDYFNKAVIKNNLSSMSLSSMEVKKSPGAMGDFQRVLQAMPGVAFSDDQNNELLVRGGSPNENLTILDHMELHSTNHYPNEMNSGGPINMINTDLIQDIQFSTGGFISKYGDKLSSVMQVTSREGTRLKKFSGEFNLTMAGAGAILEGSLAKGKGSWVVSFRKSYLDLIAGATGLTSVPKYYDGQYKVVLDLNKDHKLQVTGIYGNDKIYIDGESDEVYPDKANTSDFIDVYAIDVKQRQWANGITLRSNWKTNFFSDITLYANQYKGHVDVRRDFTNRVFDEFGGINYADVLTSKAIFNNEYRNTELALKTEFNYYITKKNKIEFGGSIKFGEYHQDAFVDADTARYDLNKDHVFDQVVVFDGATIETRFKMFDNYKAYFYVNNHQKFFNNRLLINIGARYDYFSYSQRWNISPRLSFSYYLIPDRMSLNFAYGEFYQTQSYPEYGDRYQTYENQFLKNTHARHFVIGIDHIVREGMKMSLEAYYKTYDDMPVDLEFIHFNDRTYRSEKRINIGKKKVYGIDFLLQQKLVKNIYGTLSFSRMWTEIKDPRIGYEGETYISSYDFPYILNLVLGKRFKNLRANLNEMPFFLKYPAYLLPFSNDTEISLRWRYASGKPYTPKNYSTHEQYRAGGITWTDGAWIESDQINSERFKAYHRLDLAIYSRYNFKKWNLVTVLSIQNIYNRDNISMFQYNSDGTYDVVNQFSMIPVFGLEIEF